MAVPDTHVANNRVGYLSAFPTARQDDGAVRRPANEVWQRNGYPQAFAGNVTFREMTNQT